MFEFRIKELREKKGYTQEELSVLSGIDQSNISKLENGIRLGSAEQFLRLALALGTSVDYLMGITDSLKPHPRSEYAKKLIKKANLKRHGGK